MPILEREEHPFLNLGENIKGKRMIVGTFPVYSITYPQTELKKTMLKERGDRPFFYGSRSSSWWNWYQQYVDGNTDIQNVDSIINSLDSNGIAISDVIKYCYRKEYSFQDTDLHSITWNMDLSKRISSGIEKIICTSKSEQGAMGWLRKEILSRSGFSFSESKTKELHTAILSAIPGSNGEIRPIANVFEKNSRLIRVVAVPSPGSPFRRLNDFGRVPVIHKSDYYLNAYLNSVFDWVLS